MTDGNGIPLALVVAPANRHDMKLFEATLAAQPMVPTDLAPDQVRHLCLDRGYDYDEIRQIIEQWGYQGHIPPQKERDIMIRDIPTIVPDAGSWSGRIPG